VTRPDAGQPSLSLNLSGPWPVPAARLRSMGWPALYQCRHGGPSGARVGVVGGTLAQQGQGVRSVGQPSTTACSAACRTSSSRSRTARSRSSGMWALPERVGLTAAQQFSTSTSRNTLANPLLSTGQACAWTCWRADGTRLLPYHPLKDSSAATGRRHWAGGGWSARSRRPPDACSTCRKMSR